MKKWSIIIGIVCLILIWQLLLLYRGFKANEVEHAEQALTVARAETNLAAVSSVEYYPGDQGYHVITGENNAGEKVLVWVQKDKVWEEPLSEGVSKKQIVSKLPGPAEVKRIIPGMMTAEDGKKQPIWDVYYVTDDGEARYEYFDFYTGESIETITLAS